MNMPPPTTPEPAPAKKPLWRRRWFIISAAVVVVVLVIAAVSDPPEEDAATPTAAPAATEAPALTDAAPATDAPVITNAVPSAAERNETYIDTVLEHLPLIGEAMSEVGEASTDAAENPVTALAGLYDDTFQDARDVVDDALADVETTDPADPKLVTSRGHLIDGFTSARGAMDLFLQVSQTDDLTLAVEFVTSGAALMEDSNESLTLAIEAL